MLDRAHDVASLFMSPCLTHTLAGAHLTLAASTEPLTAFTAALVAILAGAGLVALCAQRLRLPTIPAYLLTGVAVGPSALNLIARAEDQHGGSAGAVNDIADLAVVLLMFGIGLHLDLGALRRGIGPMLIAAGVSTFLSAALLWPIAMLLGASAPTALVLAMAGALSSTAIVLRLLQERRELHRQHGRVALAILLVQDIAVAPMLIAVPLLAPIGAHGTETNALANTSTDILSRAGTTVLALAGLVLLGRFVLPRLLNIASRCGSRSMEVLTILSLAFAMFAAGVTQVLGLSPALGAFLGGFLLSATPFRHALAGQIGTLRDVALAVFFTAVGMRLDLNTAMDHLPEIILGTTALILIKTFSIGACIWMVGSTLRVALLAALALAGGGEFAIVILGVADSAGAVTPDVSSTATTIIVISMLLITPGMALARIIATKWRLAMVPPWGKRSQVHAHSHEDDSTNPSRHVIVAGYGLVGRAVSDRLTATGDTVTVIEMNMQTVHRQQRMGRAFVFGDVSDPAVLESAGLLVADALVLTIPDEHAVARACTTARALRPDLFIVARASYMSRGVLAKSLGASAVVVEEMVTAEAMEKIVEEELASRDAGKPPQATQALSSQASAPHPAPPDTPSPPQ